MKIEDLLWTFIIFSLFVVASVFVVSDINRNYDTDMDTSAFNQTYNTIDEMYNISDSMREKVIEADIEGGQETYDSAVKSSYSAMRLIRGTYGLFGAILNDFSLALGVPGYFIKFAVAAFSILIVTMIIFFVTRLRS